MGYLKWILNHLWKIDKLYHAIAGIVIYIIGALLFEPYIGVLLAFVAGAGKEIYDEFYRKTGGDPWDYFATITPAIIAFLINLLF